MLRIGFARLMARAPTHIALRVTVRRLARVGSRNFPMNLAACWNRRCARLDINLKFSPTMTRAMAECCEVMKQSRLLKKRSHVKCKTRTTRRYCAQLPRNGRWRKPRGVTRHLCLIMWRSNGGPLVARLTRLNCAMATRWTTANAPRCKKKRPTSSTRKPWSAPLR